MSLKQSFTRVDSMSQETLLEKPIPFPTQPTSRTRRIIPFIIHGSILAFYTLICLLVLQNMQADKIHGANVMHTPARPAIKYEPLVYNVPLEVDSPYVGEPRQELDDAWHNLLQYTNIRVSADEMKQLGRLEQGVLLPRGDYFGSLFVYHQLHCIKRLHHYMFEDHYFPNITATEKIHNHKHNMHCLDVLRQGIQCQGDAALLTMRWGKRQAVPLGNFTSQHECVNWDSLTEWSKERSVDMFAPGVLVHPTLGPSFPGGRVGRIGVAEDD